MELQQCNITGKISVSIAPSPVRVDVLYISKTSVHVKKTVG